MWFFLKENFGHADKFMLSPTWKGFNFFCLFKKKQNTKAISQSCEKLATWFTIDSTFLANRAPTPHDWKGRGIIKRGRGDHFITPIFSVYFFPAISKKIFPFFLQITHREANCHSISPDPHDHPQRNFVIFGHSLISALKQAKLQCQQIFVVLSDNIRDWKLTYIYIEKCHKIFWTNQLPIFSRLWSTFSVSQKRFKNIPDINFTQQTTSQLMQTFRNFQGNPYSRYRFHDGYFLVAGNLKKIRKFEKYSHI